MLKWFGDNWGAPCCVDMEHTETPTGRPCMACQKPIAAEDRGFVMPFLAALGQPATMEPTHLDCFLAAVLPEMTAFRAQLLPRRSPPVHVLRHGFALCGRLGVPGEWPEGERWVRLDEAHLATCEACARIAPAVSQR